MVSGIVVSGAVAVPPPVSWFEQRSCRRKVRLRRRRAERAVDALHRAGEWGLHVYRCRFCGGWHVGHATGGR